jgi:hypothetical protein
MFASFRQKAIQNNNAQQNQIPISIAFSPQMGAPFANPIPQQVNNYWPMIARYLSPSIQTQINFPRFIPQQAPLPLPPIPQMVVPV